MMAAPKRPKDRVKWLIDRGSIQPEFGVLAEQIIRLAEKKAAEPSPHMHFDGGSGGGGDSPGAMVRVSARQSWERMFRKAGPDAEAIVSAIIVDGMTAAEASVALNVHPRAVMPLLKLALGFIGGAV